MAKRLTIGMCCFDDYHGVYFSVQALRLYHPEIEKHVQILVIDNNPNGPHAKAVKNLMDSIPNGDYYPFDEYKSTSIRNLVFERAQTPYVLCMDSHVFFPPGVLKKLLDFYKIHPKSKDLYQGPLLYDDLKTISTHFEPVWREQMWGIWETDPRGTDPDGEPFEIPMQGLGVFTCRKDAWLGFDPLFRGFGGEEGYIHEKFRQAGVKTYCLPFLRWMHRFDRPDGVKFPLTWEHKVRNYLIGHLELGLDTQPIIDHFSKWQSRALLEQMRQDSAFELVQNDPKYLKKHIGQLEKNLERNFQKKPLISCIMPTYNRPPNNQILIEEAIESFLRQDFTNSELIILNDCPGQTLQYKHPRVRIYNAKNRFGDLGAKLNVLTDLSMGDLICRWDDDDISLPWRLSWCFNQIQRQHVDYIISDGYWFDDGFGYKFEKGGVSWCMYKKELHYAIGGYSNMSCGEGQDFEMRAIESGYKYLRKNISKKKCYYIYRWNTGSEHLSGLGEGESGWILAGKSPVTARTYHLNPHWEMDYAANVTNKINNFKKPSKGKVNIKIKTVNSSNEILPNTEFILTAPDGTEILGRTCKDGTFNLNNMLKGKYKARIKEIKKSNR